MLINKDFHYNKHRLHIVATMANTNTQLCIVLVNDFST